MALGESTQVIYLKISDGKVRRKCSEGEQGAQMRKVEINGEVRVLWEQVHTFVSGMIESIYRTEHEKFGVSFNIRLIDGDETYNVSLSEKSRYFQSFAQLLPNVDFSKPVTIKPYSIAIPNSEYKNQGLTIYQDDEKVPNHFKDWDDDNKVSILKNGLEKFDWSKAKKKSQKDILKIKILDFLSTCVEYQIERLQEFKDGNDAESVKAESVDIQDEEDNDLPF